MRLTRMTDKQLVDKLRQNVNEWDEQFALPGMSDDDLASAVINFMFAGPHGEYESLVNETRDIAWTIRRRSLGLSRHLNQKTGELK